MTQSPPQPPTMPAPGGPPSMPPPPPPSTRGPERFDAPVEAPVRASWPQALGAGLALLFLVVGVPVLLWTLTGAPPFPDGFPGRDELTQPLSIDALFAVLRAVVWLAWLQFTVCTVVEVVSIVRGGGLPKPVPLSGPAQALARALVGTVLIGSSLFATSAAATADAPDTGSSGQGVVATSVQGPTAAEVRGAVDQSVTGGAAQQKAPDRVQVPGVPSSMTDVIDHRVVVVQPPDGHYHDNLWDIAERHLGDGRRWQEIYELNKGRTQPDGQELVIGRLIQPGWVLIVPDDAVDAPRVQAAPTQSQAMQDRASRADREAAGADGAADVKDAGGAQDQVQADDGSGVAGFVGGGLVAAMLAGLLLLERRRRRGPSPTDADLEAEVELRAGADHDRVERLDRALRSLSAHCRSERVPLPQVYAATVDDAVIGLRIAPPVASAPAPWAAVDEGATWRLDRQSDLPEGTGHAPYPGLVCFGRDDSGADVLVDLEAVGGVLALSGSHSVAREVVSAIAVQLATVPWADAQVVHGFDLSTHLAPVAGDVLRPVTDLDAFVAEWTDAGPGRPAQEVLGGRLGRRPGVQPQYLLLGSVPDDDSRAAVGALGAGGTRGVGVVSAVAVPGSRWRVHVDDTGRLTIPLLDIDVQAVRLTDTVAASLAELFARVRSEAAPASGERPPVPDPPRPGADTEWRLAEVSVGVLGSVVVRAGGRIDPSRLELATEIVAFLALQPAPVHPSVVGASVWPRGVTPEVRDATIERVREWLGTIDGVHALGQNSDGRLFLSDQVSVDWHALCTLLQRSRDTNPDDERDLLRRALRLVRGGPLEGRPGRRYSWLPRTRIEHQSADMVVDAAHRLAVLSFDDDPDGAAAACRSGLRLAPESQVLWRDLLTAESRNPDGPGTAGAVDEMMSGLHVLGVPLDAETEALVVELLPGSDAPAAGASA
ncbi:LysM peptidoglycan-binding domain-containing protein [Nocardioides sp.]|uniref:LysM peptidoglycan-binding domain-containing protein n=1 Tax=Nocardioides sp. TaxID=35761 RepID=UPI0027240FE2|nr:LysM peptidoglycan-binding domain-containing protein [Nocardioides sp.]MDO9454769.1 LysM peptidoglycan-binding domain-containing protein [Nocardioides sp.]